MVSKKPIYLGPPVGFYDPENFNNFAQIDVPLRLKTMGCPSKCNMEEHNANSVTYHYPDAGIGITYITTTPHRCMVSLLGTREDTVRGIESFIVEKDNEPLKS